MGIVLLDHIQPSMDHLVGGKAIGCAEMKRMGLLVPFGFSVSTRAFDEFVKENQLRINMEHTLSLFSSGTNEDALRTACENLQEQILNAAVPKTLRESLLKFTRTDTRYAVRSSATIEDTFDASFAGVFHSELYICRRDIEGAILNCWKHFFDYTVITQVLRNNMDPSQMGVALLIQEMVPADMAGVLFTMDPTNREVDAAVLSVVSGTGEKLMDGRTESHHVMLSRKTGKPKGENHFKQIPGDQLKILFKSGMMLEKKWGHPQDIEWAIVKGELVFLQARPVTTVPVFAIRNIEWTRELAEERYPKPISPLGWSVLKDLFRENLKVLSKRFGLTARHPDHVAITIKHHVYANRHFFKIPSSLRPNPLKQKRLFFDLAKEQGEVFRYFSSAVSCKGPYGLKWLMLTRFFKGFIFPHAQEILADWDLHLKGHIDEMDHFNEVPFETLTISRLMTTWEEMNKAAISYMEPDLAIYVVKMACSWMIEKIIAEASSDNSLAVFTDLTGALEKNRTLDMNADMMEMSAFIKSDGTLSFLLKEEKYDAFIAEFEKKDKERLRSFIDKNGHLTTNWDIMAATWGENPVKICHMLRSFVFMEEAKRFHDYREEGNRKLRAAQEYVTRQFSGSPWMTAFFQDTLHYLREFMRIDEEHHFYCSRLFKPGRRLFLNLGKRLFEKHVLSEPDDIFFLTFDEICHLVENESFFTRRYVIQSRKNSFRQSLSVRPPDSYTGFSPVPESLDSAMEIKKNQWKGVAASAGSATGIVRIVEDVADARSFSEGEIFVTTSPNPAFTPLFGIASGLITSTGSILSHGLVSAREYRLPAVSGIPDITGKLKNGQKVKVDGDKGIVTVL